MSSSSTERPLTAREELAITRAMMYGCTFMYYDFGHPERTTARKYHKCCGGGSEFDANVIGYGHSEAEAALDWLRRTGRQGDLNVRKQA